MAVLCVRQFELGDPVTFSREGVSRKGWVAGFWCQHGRWYINFACLTQVCGVPATYYVTCDPDELTPE